MEGFTHLIPFAAGHEVIRQQRRGPDAGADDARPHLRSADRRRLRARLVFSWGGNPGVGSLHRLRDAVEHGWPRPLALEEYSHGAMANAYDAGAANLPFAAFRTHPGGLAEREPALPHGDLSVHRRDARPRCRRCGRTSPSSTRRKPIARATSSSTGIIGVQKEAVLAARRAVVTVEEVVDTLRRRGIANACILPRWTIGAIAVVPGGAFPSYAFGYYARDNAFYRRVGRDLARPATVSAPGSTSTSCGGPEAFAARGRRVA